MASGTSSLTAASSERPPRVSVVIPCYNGGKFIRGVLGSLDAQTFRDFETIIVDDGSTDPSTQKRLASLSRTLTVIRQPNAGPAAARNTGTSAAKGEFVLTVDCDDLLQPTFLEETVAALQAAGPDVGFTFTDMRLIGLSDGIARRHFKLFDQLFTNRVACCILFRKEAWRAAGGYDETMRDGYEDWEFTIALARAGYRGLAISKPLFIYRVNAEGMMMTRSSPHHAELWHFIRRKHRELYAPKRLLTLWWQTRSTVGTIRLPIALLLLLLANAMPDRWFSTLIHWSRSVRIRKKRPQNEAATVEAEAR